MADYHVFVTTPHLVPHRRRQGQRHRRIVEPHLDPACAIVEQHRAPSRHRHRQLVERAMGVEPAGHAGRRAKHITDPRDRKRDVVAAEFADL